MSLIHHTAIIDPEAKLGEGVSVGAYSIIGSGVEVGDGTSIGPHVVIQGPTKLGKNNKIFQFASIGEQCQDLKYAGETTYLEIGDNNTIRESVTMHRGTVQDEGITRVGSNNLFMVNVHVAHDCIIGDHCIFANNATLAGHVHIGHHVIFGGHVAIHQFGQVGDYAFAGGCAAINKDLPPYVMAVGHYAKPVGVNSEGLRRNGFSKEAISAVKKAYRILYRQEKNLAEAMPELETLAAEFPEVARFTEFLQKNQRGIMR